MSTGQGADRLQRSTGQIHRRDVGGRWLKKKPRIPSTSVSEVIERQQHTGMGLASSEGRIVAPRGREKAKELREHSDRNIFHTQLYV
jgi:hypothetical protein